MRVRFPASCAVAIAAVSTVAAALITTGTASGHGTSTNPVSRVYGCYLEGPESPDTPACQAAVAAGGTQPLYDWNEINLANANGQHRSIIPDGKLCSAGRSKYAAFDAPRTDWATTTLPASGGSYPFRFRATAPHVGTFEFYVTNPGYVPTSPLKWSDLGATPFLRMTNPAARSPAGNRRTCPHSGSCSSQDRRDRRHSSGVAPIVDLAARSSRGAIVAI